MKDSQDEFIIKGLNKTLDDLLGLIRYKKTKNTIELEIENSDSDYYNISVKSNSF